MVNSHRRRLAFSLRTLFVLLTVFGVWLGWQVQIVRERKELLKSLDGRKSIRVVFSAEVPVRMRGGHEASIPIWRCWLGDKPVQFVFILFVYPPDKTEQLKAAFPEARFIDDFDTYAAMMVTH